MFQRCADHKIIIMPLLPTVILFIDTDITARNNVDKYCNTEIIFSLEDLSFFSFCILHCSVYIIVVYKLKYQARKNFSFQNIIKNQPSLCCNFWRWFNSYCNCWRCPNLDYIYIYIIFILFTFFADIKQNNWHWLDQAWIVCTMAGS